MMGRGGQKVGRGTKMMGSWWQKVGREKLNRNEAKTNRE
jgi:hypothetical protein